MRRSGQQKREALGVERADGLADSLSRATIAWGVAATAVALGSYAKFAWVRCSGRSGVRLPRRPRPSHRFPPVSLLSPPC